MTNVEDLMAVERGHRTESPRDQLEHASDEASPSPFRDGNESSPSRRGHKRRLEDDTGVAPGISGSISEEKNSSVLQSGDKNNEKGLQEASTTDTSESMTKLPDGIHLEWNSQKTKAILYVVEGRGTSSQPEERELRVCMVGRARISLLEGAAEILGHSLVQNDRIGDASTTTSQEPFGVSPEGIEVTSPFWSSWMTIEINAASLPCRIALECIRGPRSFQIVGPKRPVVIPQSWKACATDILRKCSEYNEHDTTKGHMVESLEDYEDSGNVKVPKHCIQNANHRIVCMITGAKGVGKSTLLRYMTNRILSQRSSDDDHAVAILDADVGQPELAPPGLLRLSVLRKPLLRPPYWNLVSEINDEDEALTTTMGQQNESYQMLSDLNSGMEVVSSIFFGAVTSKVDPGRYIKSVQSLMEKYENLILPSSHHPIPLLINTDGWVKSTGYQVLMALITSLRPTHLVQILGDSKGQTFQIPETMVRGNETEDSPGTIVYEPDEPVRTTESQLPILYRLPACQTLPGASFYRISASTMRNFRWAAYFLPRQVQTFDAWDFVSVKSLQTGWIVATNSDETTYAPQWLFSGTDDVSNHEDRQSATYNEKDYVDKHELKTKSNQIGGLSDECRLSQALARERPYCVPMEAIEPLVVGSDFEDFLNSHQAERDSERIRIRTFQALNGRIVALCADISTMETIGYGILRSIDWTRNLLYVLVPPSISLSVLSSVTTLVGGGLPLPLSMLYRGLYAESVPYLTEQSTPLNNAVLGSEPMKSRNSITRRGLTPAERNRPN